MMKAVQVLLLVLSVTAGVADASEVYVVDHGWHAGLVLPAAAVEQAMPFLAERFDSPRFYEFGWGDEGFYTAREIGAGLALRALLLPTASVVHVVAIHTEPSRYFASGDMHGIELDAEQMTALLDFILTVFALDDQGAVRSLRVGIYGDSQFYGSHMRYHLLRTCNTWGAQALRHAAVDIDDRFVLTSRQLMSALRKLDQ